MCCGLVNYLKSETYRFLEIFGGVFVLFLGRVVLRFRFFGDDVVVAVAHALAKLNDVRRLFGTHRKAWPKNTLEIPPTSAKITVLGVDGGSTRALGNGRCCSSRRSLLIASRREPSWEDLYSSIILPSPRGPRRHGCSLFFSLYMVASPRFSYSVSSF